MYRVSEAVTGNGKTAVFQGKIKTKNGRFFLAVFPFSVSYKIFKKIYIENDFRDKLALENLELKNLRKN